jgi:hypothetical protein
MATAALADFGEFSTWPNPFVWLVRDATSIALGIAVLAVLLTCASSPRPKRLLGISGLTALLVAELDTLWLPGRTALLVFPAMVVTFLLGVAFLWPRAHRPDWLTALVDKTPPAPQPSPPVFPEAGATELAAPTAAADLHSVTPIPAVIRNATDGTFAAPAAPQSSIPSEVQDAGSSPRRIPKQAWTLSIVTAIAASLGIFWFLGPANIFSQGLISSGDMSGHFLNAWWTTTHYLPHGQLSGWFPGYYNGFPLYTFYFPLPELMVAALHLVVSLPLAFKLIIVGSLIFMPIAGWIFGWATTSRPAPAAACALAVTYILFSQGYRNWGGSLTTTMQGEFSYTWALAFGMIALGLGIRALRRRKGAPLVIIVFAATLLCHLVVFTAFMGAFAACVAVDSLLRYRRAQAAKRAAHELTNPQRSGVFGERSVASTIRHAAIIGFVVLGLTAFWWLPFFAWSQLTSSNYFPQLSYNTWLNYWTQKPVDPLVPLAIFAIISLSWRRSAAIAATGCLWILAIIAGPLMPADSSIDPGHWMPIFYYSAALLAALGFVELLRLTVGVLRRTRFNSRLATTASVAVLSIGMVGLAVQADWAAIGINRLWTTALAGYQVGPYHTEYKDLYTAVANASDKYGCGMAASESTPAFLNYGDMYAFSLMPYWTDGCVTTLTGLLTESSATADYSEYTSDILSYNPIGIAITAAKRTPKPDIVRGIAQLQALGARYYVAYTSSAVAIANKSPELQLIDTVPLPADQVVKPAPGHWHIYLVKDPVQVGTLTYAPAVYTGPQSYDQAGQNWWMHAPNYAVPLAQTGPASWPRTASALTPPKHPLPSQQITSVHSGADKITFTVARVGVPVIVRTSYFPNWTTEGTGAIYRVTPNMMVVVPASHHVTLVYGTAPVEILGKVISYSTLLGAITCWCYFAIRRRMGKPSADTPSGDDQRGPQDTPSTTEPAAVPHADVLQ